jgi:putative FmdB family regulatory protein
MPTYVYKREDGSTFEVMQRITEEPLDVCPTTGQKVQRLIGGGAGLIFKGDGFYLTDYARKNGSEKAPENSESGTDSAATADKPSSSPEKSSTSTAATDTD